MRNEALATHIHKWGLWEELAQFVQRRCRGLPDGVILSKGHLDGNAHIRTDLAKMLGKAKHLTQLRHRQRCLTLLQAFSGLMNPTVGRPKGPGVLVERKLDKWGISQQALKALEGTWQPV